MAKGEYTKELDAQINFMLKEIIKKLVNEVGIHPLDQDYLELLRTKISAAAVEVLREMKKND